MHVYMLCMYNIIKRMEMNEGKGNWWGNAKQWVYFYVYTDKNSTSMPHITLTSDSITTSPIESSYLDIHFSPTRKQKLSILLFYGLPIGRTSILEEAVSPLTLVGDAC